MAIFNRFADPAEEVAYYRVERERWRPGIRALIVISIVIVIFFVLVNPMFFPAEAMYLYNAVSGAILIAQVVAWVVVGTDYYLRWRWLDALMFVVLVVGISLLIVALAGTRDDTGEEFFGPAMFNLTMLFAFASVTFIANFRWFLIWSVTLMAGWTVLVAVQPLGLFPKVFTVASVGIFFTFALFVNWVLDYRARQIFTANRALEAEKAKTEGLLYNVLPQAIAQRLRAGEAVADSFSDLTVIFADIVGFSVLAKTLSPGHLVRMLNEFFLLADQCAERHGIEKVKTIGDAYLAVSGGTVSSHGGACEAISFARDLVQEMRDLAERSGVNIALRVGLHTGPVVGGVVGSSRLAYDYWGDTMNIASRIEGAATPGGIALSEATALACGRAYEFSPPEIVTLKGVGEMTIRRMEV